MAASFSVTLTCDNCGKVNTYTNLTEAAKSPSRPNQCTRCGARWNFFISSMALVHSGSIGSNDTLTHTMATRGTIVSAAS